MTYVHNIFKLNLVKFNSIALGHNGTIICSTTKMSFLSYISKVFSVLLGTGSTVIVIPRVTMYFPDPGLNLD